MNEKTDGFVLMEPASPEALLPGIGLWPWFLAGGLILLAVVALIVFLKTRRAKIDPLAIRNAAFSEALRSLAETRPADARDAAVRSSLIVRRYLASAAGDPALFETHEEFVSRHDSLQALKPEVRAEAESVFSRLAAWKYAPVPADENPEGIVTSCRDLLTRLHEGFAA